MLLVKDTNVPVSFSPFVHLVGNLHGPFQENILYDFSTLHLDHLRL